MPRPQQFSIRNSPDVRLARPQCDQSLIAVCGDSENSLSMRWVKFGFTTCMNHADGAGAPTHAKVDVAEELGIDRRTVSTIGQEFGITFKAPTRGGARNLVPRRADEASDAKYAERIRAFLELGLTRRQCLGRLAMGSKAFERIVAAHGIDYPKAKPGRTKCAA